MPVTDEEVDAAFGLAPAATPTPAPAKGTPNVPTRGQTPTDQIRAGLNLGTATRSAALQHGDTPAEADRKANEATETMMVVGPVADSNAVRDQLRAHQGPDDAGKTAERALGRRVVPVPYATPDQIERDDEYRRRVEENTPGSALAGAIEGEEQAPITDAGQHQKAWLRAARDGATRGLVTALSGGIVPAIDIVRQLGGAESWFGEAPVTPTDLTDIAEGAAKDPDYKRVTNLATAAILPSALDEEGVADVVGTVGVTLARSGAGGIAGKMAGLVDDGQTALFWDDAHPREEFDGAAEDFYSTKDRTAVDALPVRALPARLRGETIDVDAFLRAAQEDPDLSSVAAVKDLDPAVIEAEIARLPIGIAARYQPSLSPTNDELTDTIRKRHNAKKWRGDEQFESMANLFAAGMLKPVGNGDEAIFVPSAWQEAMRYAQGMWAAGFIEPDVHPLQIIAPFWDPEAPEEDDQSLSAKLKAMRIINPYGVESMIRSGAYDDWLERAGLRGGESYATLANPDSTWWSRTLTDVAMPEYANRGYKDIYLRAGGNPNSLTADLLGTADIATQFLFPVEEMAMAPMGAALRSASRASRARSAARELGVRGGVAGRVAVPWAVGETDALAAMGNGLQDEVRDLIESGRFNPDDLGPRELGNIRALFHQAGVDDAPIVTNELLGWLRDRRAAVFDVGAEIGVTGGPVTESLRMSPEYLDVARDLEKLPNLSPAERDVVMRSQEVAALNAWDAGEIARPEDWFAGQMWEPTDDPARAGVSKQMSDWVVKTFSSGNVEDAIRDSAPLMALMRPDFEARAAKVFDSVNGRLTREGHEQLAEATTRILRGIYRPGSRVDNLAKDVLDTLGDVWTRIRDLPVVESIPDRIRSAVDNRLKPIPAEFRRLWDDTFRPGDRLKGTAVKLVDERQGRSFPYTVKVSEDVPTEIRERKVEKAGKGRFASSVERNPAEVRAALGLKAGEQVVDPVELLSNAIAYLGVEKLRKQWGAVGELKTLPSGRTAVPVERHGRVLADAERRRNAIFGGKMPTPIEGSNALRFDADQQAALRRMVAEVAESPLGERLPARFNDPDLSIVSAKDWNDLNNEFIDLRAGHGAWREKNAEAAVVPGIVRLMNAAERWADKNNAGTVVDSVRKAFVSQIAADDLLQPAQREVIKTFLRDLGNSNDEVGKALVQLGDEWRRGNRNFEPVDLVLDLARSMGPEVVPVATLPLLGRVEELTVEPALPQMAARLDEVSRLFREAPVNEAQMAAELTAIEAIDRIWRRMDPDAGADLSVALESAGLTEAQANDAMAIVLEGIRRRSAAVDDVGHEIARMFAGSDDETLLRSIPNPGEQRRLFRETYENWYSGDQTKILQDMAGMGRAAAGDLYDQGDAILGTLLRLNLRRKFGDLARRMAESGMVGDVAKVAQPGLAYDRPYTLGGYKTSRDVWLQDVADYISAEMGWQTTGIRRGEEYGAGRGTVTRSGRIDKTAYDEALRQINRWGMAPGSNVTAWNQVDLPGGSRVLLPKVFEDAVREAVTDAAPDRMAYGRRWSGDPRVGELTPGATETPRFDHRAINAAAESIAKMWNYSFGMLKKGMLTGIGPLIRPAYYVNNLFGGMNQLYQGMGLVGALSTAAKPLLPTVEGKLMRSVIKRMAGFGEDVPTVGMFTKDGRYITDQMIASKVAEQGLNTSVAKSEWAPSIMEEVKASTPGMWNAIQRSGLPGTRKWRQWLDEGATAIDNYYRVATYVDAIKGGASVEEAANLARRVAFDYNDLTEFERKIARQAILFYSFQRRNQDLFWWTFLNHPSRVAGQLRLMYGMQENNLGPDSELYVSPYQEGRAVLSFRDPFKEGHLENAQRGAMTLTPSMNVDDGVGLWLDILGAVPSDDLDPEAGKNLVGRLNPWLVAPFAMWSGVDTEKGQELLNATAKVPQPIVDADYAISSLFVDLDDEVNGGMLTRDVFQARPVAPWDDADGETVYEVDRTSPSAVRWWWAFNNLLPATSVARNVTQMERMTDEPRVGLSEAEEFGQWMGFPAATVPTREKVVGTLRDQRAKELERKGREVGKGSVVSGRGQ